MFEMLEVADSEVRAFEQGRTSGVIKPTDYIKLGNFSGEARLVKGVFVQPLETTQPEVETEEWKKYYAKRNFLLKLTPEERAVESSWGHYALFHYGVFGKAPSEKLKPEIQALAAKFYTENPEWTKPSVKCWADYLEINAKTKMNASTLRILERVELRELIDIKTTKEWREKSGDSSIESFIADSY